MCVVGTYLSWPNVLEEVEEEEECWHAEHFLISHTRFPSLEIAFHFPEWLVRTRFLIWHPNEIQSQALLSSAPEPQTSSAYVRVCPVQQCYHTPAMISLLTTNTANCFQFDDWMFSIRHDWASSHLTWEGHSTRRFDEYMCRKWQSKIWIHPSYLDLGSDDPRFQERKQRTATQSPQSRSHWEMLRRLLKVFLWLSWLLAWSWWLWLSLWKAYSLPQDSSNNSIRHMYLWAG